MEFVARLLSEFCYEVIPSGSNWTSVSLFVTRMHYFLQSN